MEILHKKQTESPIFSILSITDRGNKLGDDRIIQHQTSQLPTRGRSTLPDDCGEDFARVDIEHGKAGHYTGAADQGKGRLQPDDV